MVKHGLHTLDTEPYDVIKTARVKELKDISKATKTAEVRQLSKEETTEEAVKNIGPATTSKNN
ncbi:hypothetical protein PC123_g6762 [Phytophthora cactorum]|nr:hypothetical protein PC120_g6793 [Phytophthora cactorum]KAG4058256.1 hypothetical protein PC123_g6762 [Phytophthora cactorum]